MGRGARPTGHPRGLPVTWSKGPDGILLVRLLRGLAPDLKVEESNSAMAQGKKRFESPRLSSRGY